MAEPTYKELLPKIDTLIFDVDGVYTDGSITMAEPGKPFRTYNSKDTFATQLAVKEGYRVIIITGGTSDSVRELFGFLGVKEVHLRSIDKGEVLDGLVADGLDPATCLYMGDDLPDIPVLKRVLLPCAPADACVDTIEAAHYVSTKPGGRGCVRDVIEQVMRVQGKWMREGSHKW